MKIVFTLHALEQMKERKIHREWVLETLLRPDEVEQETSIKWLAKRRLNGHTLEVVFERRTNIKVITLYWIQ